MAKNDNNNKGKKSSGRRRGGKKRGKRRRGRKYDQKIIDLARVTRVTAGGKRMSFRTALVIGDRKGKVGFGVAKGKDIGNSIEKAYRRAKKNIIEIPMIDETLPHPVRQKFGAAEIILKPAPKGTGLKSGGAVREILEIGGVPNAVSKIINSNNKINIAKATLEAVQSMRMPSEVPTDTADNETVQTKAETPQAEETQNA